MRYDEVDEVLKAIEASSSEIVCGVLIESGNLPNAYKRCPDDLFFQFLYKSLQTKDKAQADQLHAALNTNADYRIKFVNGLFKVASYDGRRGRAAQDYFQSVLREPAVQTMMCAKLGRFKSLNYAKFLAFSYKEQMYVPPPPKSEPPRRQKLR